jgi:hypothetical protein
VLEGLTLEFAAPSGAALRLEWSAEALLELGADAGPEPLWTLGGELDWDQIDRLRTVSARLDDDSLIAVAALRPAGSDGHGDELVAGALGNADGLERLDETLLSTETGPDGTLRRIGLELWRGDGGIAVRVAGDVTDAGEGGPAGIRRRWSRLAVRSAGRTGTGVIDTLSAA